MSDSQFDLGAMARQEMLAEGFHPDFPPAVDEQVKALESAAAAAAPNGDARDLRSLLWSSIDNDTSRDLDQAEVAERVSGGIRVMIAIADVDSDVPIGSSIVMDEALAPVLSSFNIPHSASVVTGVPVIV